MHTYIHAYIHAHTCRMHTYICASTHAYTQRAKTRTRTHKHASIYVYMHAREHCITYIHTPHKYIHAHSRCDMTPYRITRPHATYKPSYMQTYIHTSIQA